ncbi:MAG: hypothetical protein ACF8SC_10835 [Phycisphaerales bacterium JB037]
MNRTTLATVAASTLLSLAGGASAQLVTIGTNEFDLAQFTGASVTYRADGSVTFDGKNWDQAAGVDGYTLGELAAGQFGSDPGDQISLNDRVNPDWLQLNYGTPFLYTGSQNKLVIYEISSFTSVDPEGLSFQISVNGGPLVPASAASASNFWIGVGSDGPAEDINELVFDLSAMGFNPGDTISTIYIENIDSGSGTSDPDFIFAGITTPAPGSAALLALGGIAAIRRRRA